MRHRRRGRKLSRSAAHRDALMMNLAAALIEHGRIKTTLPKAKELRPYIERLITEARKNDLHSRRVVQQKLRLDDAASKRTSGEPTIMHRLIHEVAPRFVDRPGGYTRIVKIGPRSGDAAPMAFIEFVDHVPEAKGESHGHTHAHAHDHEQHAHA